MGNFQYLISLHLPFLLSLFLIISHQSKPNADSLRFFINSMTENREKSSETALEESQMGLIADEAGRNSFPPCQQAMEPAAATAIEENFTGNEAGFRAAVGGKVRGMYVASLKNSRILIIAMTARFSESLNDSLRFFGVQKEGLMEFQIAVIGGSGKYDGANGFAMVKSVGGETKGIGKKLLFNVYLS